MFPGNRINVEADVFQHVKQITFFSVNQTLQVTEFGLTITGKDLDKRSLT